MAGSITDYLQLVSGAPSGAPDIPGAEWCFAQRTDTGDIYYWDLDTSAWVIVAGATAVYPTRATLWHDEALMTTGNALDRQHDASSNYATETLQNASANGDTFTQSFLLDAGTYTLAALGITSGFGGKIDWKIDGSTVISGQDWYSGSTTRNVLKTASVTVATDGYHVLTGVVNGKNASSSGYNIQLTKYWLYPSAD